MLPIANMIIILRESSLTEGIADALKENKIKPLIINKDGRKRLFLVEGSILRMT